MRNERYSKLSRAEQREYNEWLDLCERIKNQTEIAALDETSEQKTKRLNTLKNDFVKFCRYYFPHYMDSDFGWFHKKAAKEITNDKRAFAVLEWAREHAKSVFANIMMPLFLYARGELTGMVLASANFDKASVLLADIQAELEANMRLQHDFDFAVHMGGWKDGHFVTMNGVGFWCFGRGQSPRGIRVGAKRPNYAVVDDIDDKVIVRNEQRVNEAMYWILEDLYGALSIQGARLIIAGNRIHKKSILAKLVGDVEHGDPKRKGIIHIKVFAFENPKTHKKSDHINGKPAWKERYKVIQLKDKMDKMGFRASRREYFHEHHEEGLIFQNKWVQWKKMLPFEKYDAIVEYTDPSFKDTKKSDYKATVRIGKIGKELHVMKAFVRQCTATIMVQNSYDNYEELGNHSRYYMEANFLQDLLLDEFTDEGERREYQMPIRGDKRKKENKEVRIENLSPLWERGFWFFNQAERHNADMQTLISQFMGFPYGHDDGPDACEGAVYFLQRIGRSSKFVPRMGKYRRKPRD